MCTKENAHSVIQPVSGPDSFALTQAAQLSTHKHSKATGVLVNKIGNNLGVDILLLLSPDQEVAVTCSTCHLSDRFFKKIPLLYTDCQYGIAA